jgi:DNA-binding transcriptional ArsR family regulator
MTDLLAAVAEPNRRRLLQLLAAGEQPVSVLAAHFDVSRSAISQHLGVLVNAGLVVRRRDGRFQHYRLAPTGVAALRAELDAFWTTELDNLLYDALSHPSISALERQP